MTTVAMSDTTQENIDNVKYQLTELGVELADQDHESKIVDQDTPDYFMPGDKLIRVEDFEGVYRDWVGVIGAKLLVFHNL